MRRLVHNIFFRIAFVTTVSATIGSGASSLSFGWFLPHGAILGGLVGCSFSTLIFGGQKCIQLYKEKDWLTRRRFFGVVVLGCTFFLSNLGIGLIILAPETICLWNPLVDTVLSQPSIVDDFKKVKLGMSTREVVDLIGKPLTVDSNMWQYTNDGKCGETCDRAWLFLAVFFEDDRVVKIWKQWSYD